MKNKLFLKTWLVAGFSALSILYSCTDEDYSAGVSLHPPSELISVHFDSSQTCEAYSYEMENHINISSSYPLLLLGYSNDPILGESRSDIISHVGFINPLDDSLNMKFNIIVDAVILYVKYNNSDGDTTQSQQISVYELEKNVDLTHLDGEILYPETLDGYIQEDMLTSFTFEPRINWPTDESVEKYGLPKEFGERLLETQYIVGADTLNPYDSDSLFNALTLSGLYFKAVADEGRKSTSTIYFDSTRIEVQYRKQSLEGVDLDTLTSIYETNNQYKANIFNHNFSNNIVVNDVHTDVSMSESNDYVYLKNNNGLRARIHIEDIGNWEDSTNVSINKASVILNFVEEEGLDTLYNPIYTLNVYREIGNTLQGLQDHYNSEVGIQANNSAEGYEIIFTSEMQDMIKNNERSITILLQSTSNASLANRSVMLQPKHINITYSKY